MSTITRDDPAALGLSGMACDIHAPAKVKSSPTLYVRYCTMTAAVAVAVVALVAGLPNRNNNELAQLERLAPKIEKARTLSPEARDAIKQIVVRQSAFKGPASPSLTARQNAAMARITSALAAMQSASLRHDNSGAGGI